MKVYYIISNTFDYSSLICADAGPLFGADYGIDCIKIQFIAQLEDANAFIIDNRLTENDLAYLHSIRSRLKAPIFFKIVDPYREAEKAYHYYHKYFRYLKQAINEPRIHLLSTYGPTEFVSYLASLSTQSRIIIAPYVYDTKMEIPIDHSVRQNKVLLSGCLSNLYYPVRTAFSLQIKLYPPLRLRTDCLKHPGYRDVGDKLRHRHIGQQYLEYLARYRFAFVCSGRSRLEFLKYRELAYAGVVPVGNLPDTLMECGESAYLRWRKNPFALARQITLCRDSEEKAFAFRSFMRENRCIIKLRRHLLDQIASVSGN